MSTPVGPYSPAMRAGQWLVCSGQIGIEQSPDGPALVAGGFEAQARQALANVAGILWGRQLGWVHVVSAAYSPLMGLPPSCSPGCWNRRLRGRLVTSQDASTIGPVVQHESSAHRAPCTTADLP